MSRSIHVQILGRDYVLRVKEENESLTRQLAVYVDGKMTTFRDAHPDQSDTTAAIITALAIAEELFLERSAQEEVREGVESQLVHMEKVLSEALTAK